VADPGRLELLAVDVTTPEAGGDSAVKPAMFERFDERATRVLNTAFTEAAHFGDDAVGTEHLLLALSSADRGTARLLRDAGLDGAELRRRWVRRRVVGSTGVVTTRRSSPPLALISPKRVGAPRRPSAPTPSSVPPGRSRTAAVLWSRISCSKPLPRTPL
jgi:hypothetical protein